MFSALVLATIAQAAARGTTSGNRRSATQVVTDRLNVSRTRLHRSLVRLEDVFGDDLQHDTEFRRSGRLTDKGRAIAAAAGMLQFWLNQIADPKADHAKILARLEEEFTRLESMSDDVFSRTPKSPPRF